MEKHIIENMPTSDGRLLAIPMDRNNIQRNTHMAVMAVAPNQ